jgi:hypothetical protein
MITRTTEGGDSTACPASIRIQERSQVSFCLPIKYCLEATTALNPRTVHIYWTLTPHWHRNETEFTTPTFLYGLANSLVCAISATLISF